MRDPMNNIDNYTSLGVHEGQFNVKEERELELGVDNPDVAHVQLSVLKRNCKEISDNLDDVVLHVEFSWSTSHS